jgi:hypothetical protein
MESGFLLDIMFQGLFGVPELRSHEGFYAMKERAIWETDKLVAESCSPNRLNNYICNLQHIF